MKSLAFFAAVVAAALLTAPPASLAGDRAHSGRSACGLSKMFDGMRSRVHETATVTQTRRESSWRTTRRSHVAETYKSRSR